MRPAFSSIRHAAAFAFLLAMLLALPLLVARTGWLQRRDAYRSIPWKYGPFPWIQQKIFEEAGEVDMAFLGSSYVWADIDTPYVQRKLGQQLGRHAEVFTLGWPWPGFDALYTVARDLLDRRHVRTLVINDEAGSELPHFYSSRWFRIGENSEALAGLSLREKAKLYGGAVLGMPRHLLSVVRPNLLEDPAHTPRIPALNYWYTSFRASNFAERLGSLRAQLAYRMSPDFVLFQPHGAATPADVLIYSPETRAAFNFTGPTVVPYQLHFARRLAQLCSERGTQLVMLQMPHLVGRDQTAVFMGALWPKLLEAPVEMVGIPPQKLFSGIPGTDVPKLFFDDAHFNENGQDMFTPLITPALLRIYAESTNR